MTTEYDNRLKLPKLYEYEDPALEQLAVDGLLERLGEVPEKYWERLHHELGVIRQMGYSGYFLCLHTIIQEGVKRNLIRGPGRGSGGGSLCAYSLGIHDLDPIEHKLIFERFLNPQRVSHPDIDIDVPESQRQQWIDVITDLFGVENVAIIGTRGNIGAKAALKDANRVLGRTFGEGEKYCSYLPKAKFGRAPSLDAYSGPRDEVYDLASRLEGTIRSRGQHASGIVISPEPLVGKIPLWRPAGQKTFVTEYDMNELSALGYEKFDFLGLRTLDVINDCLRLIPEETRPELPISPSDCNDEATYRVIASGQSKGIFQMDSAIFQKSLAKLQPSEFADILTALAIVRPGAMGHIDEYAKRKREIEGKKYPKS